MRSQSVCMCVQTPSGTNLTQFVLLSYPKRIHFQLNKTSTFSLINCGKS